MTAAADTAASAVARAVGVLAALVPARRSTEGEVLDAIRAT
ncbi:hypothetical protein [Nocardioides dongxiaopingii]|nr:hypothetical protein [Nocardioides sp. S-1144]